MAQPSCLQHPMTITRRLGFGLAAPEVEPTLIVVDDRGGVDGASTDGSWRLFAGG